MAKILVVDDSESILKIVTSVMATIGHVTVTCLDPLDGLEKIAGEHFDLIITDLMMPGGISGYDFIRTLRAQPKSKALPIIILTGRREAKDIKRGVLSGADDYIVKPIDPDILTSKVTTLLNKKMKIKDSFAVGSLRAAAEFELKTEIVQISEVGLKIQTGMPMPIGMKIRLRSPFFLELGIAPPFMRVVGCEEDKTESVFNIQMHFMGLTEKEMTPIRLWIRAAKTSKG